MGDIADDHFVQLFWSEGTGIGGDCGSAPPCEHPAYGGMDAFIWRATQPRPYGCKYCGKPIGFIDRKPYNYSDGSAHRCLADARRAEANAKDHP